MFHIKFALRFIKMHSLKEKGRGTGTSVLCRQSIFLALNSLRIENDRNSKYWLSNI